MDHLVTTNVSIYRAIAADAYQEMISAINRNRTAKPDGSGWIFRYDQDQASFKSSMVTVVFTGMWLEALAHILIVRNHGEETYRKYDFKSYEDKLKLLGVEDESLLSKVKKFRGTRKELVHEKAHFDNGTIKTAQQEAELAHEIMCSVEDLLG